MPEPVGAWMRVWPPPAMAGHPCSWAGVVAAKVERNHSATGGENRSRAATADRVPGPGDASRGPGACHHGAMQHPDLAAGGHAFLTVALWAGALPAALLRDDAGVFRFDWRPVPLLALGVLMLLAGTALVFGAGRQLSRAGVRLLGVRPGPALVTDGLYGIVRNPQHVGTTLVALAPAVALAPRVMGILPLVAVVWLVVGLEPLEDRRLLEEFGDDFRDYRRAVWRWLPRWRG